jgi:nicotinate-nucleotide--dimethylbenzimidazole phosphoribosyltransferase
MTEGAAMSEAQTEQAILSGAELASDLIMRTDCLVLGEIGIGNTTAASALLAGLTGATPIQVCGRGTGLDSQGLERKRSVVERALKANPVEGSEPFQIVSRLGGFELAGLCGAILKACAHRRMVILDGFSVAVAALCAVRLCPAVRDYLIASHLSSESAHELALNELGLEALFDLRLRLGEASGAALALPLIESAGRLHREMQTFSGAGVERSR